ncbi:hypothetical protein LTR66_002730 [Elasticomyces elasticus]|nr:hypothetical protein LTR66_002730 [Elasticomyces elasticus]
MSDPDSDSQMHSNSDPGTPLAQTIPTYLTHDLSPPNSQGAPYSSMANENGKRPLDPVDPMSQPKQQQLANGKSDPNTNAVGSLTTTGNERANGEAKVHQHAKSGYTWTNEEDAPGYSWSNKRAVEEAHKSWDTTVGKEHMIEGESISRLQTVST